MGRCDCSMDRLEIYRSAIEQVLTRHQDPDDTAVRSEVIIDRAHDHYQLVNVCWQNDRRVYGCVLHLDIIDGKIWIQHNGTEFDVAGSWSRWMWRSSILSWGFSRHLSVSLRSLPYVDGW
jgi:XisI protein